MIQEVTRDLAESFGLDRPRGALVNSVEKGSPADKAGVEAGDIILAFDGKAVESSSDLPRIVGATQPGSQVDAARSGARARRSTLTLTVGELQEDRVASADSAARPEAAGDAANRLGIVVDRASRRAEARPARRGRDRGDRRARRTPGRTCARATCC